MKIQRTFCFAATVLITQLAVAKTALLGQLAQVEQYRRANGPAPAA